MQTFLIQGRVNVYCLFMSNIMREAEFEHFFIHWVNKALRNVTSSTYFNINSVGPNGIEGQIKCHMHTAVGR